MQHFMVLNTNNLSEEQGLSKDQMEWLKQDAAQSDAPVEDRGAAQGSVFQRLAL